MKRIISIFLTAFLFCTPAIETAIAFGENNIDSAEKSIEESVERSGAEYSVLEDISIADIFTTEGANPANIIVKPNPNPQGWETASFKEYGSTLESLKAAMFDLYSYGNNRDFILYIGSRVVADSAMAGRNALATGPSDVSFYSLKGRVNTIVFTGTTEDSLSNEMVSSGPNGSTSTSARLVLGDVDFGTNIVFRNITYRFDTAFMNGHNFISKGSSYHVGTSYTKLYGGSNNSDLEGSPVIEINSTGGTNWQRVFGGNQSGGVLNGSPRIIVNSTQREISSLSGGAYIGTINGSTTVHIKDAYSIDSYFGGGYGESAGNAANVTGNVATSISVDNSGSEFTMPSDFYGGVNYGNIGGTVRNFISGHGKWANTTARFIGGSAHGDIGSFKGITAVYTELDISKYSYGRASFEGGNRYSGTITGDIENVIKSAPTESGGIADFHGGGGRDVEKLSKIGIGGSNVDVYDSYTPEKRAELAEVSAKFKVYGNISSKLLSGSFSNGGFIYSTAAGRGGYIEGNTSIELGQLNPEGTTGGPGMAYKGSAPSDTSYSTSANRRGEASMWDIVGGGGYPSDPNIWDIYIKGDTSTVINNAVAKWTYGGSYSGIIEGRSSHTLNGGIVDTLEGGGYRGGRIYGDTQATIRNGQVDWFLTGGGWGDEKIVGNVSTNVYDGYINASLGGTYGWTSSHTVTGNSEVNIYGGNFSGTPRIGNNTLAAGVTNYGYILGNTKMTIDLRNYNGNFVLPTGTSISAGKSPDGSGNLGSSLDNTIELNIYTKPGVDVLNGATIYGDGGVARNTKSGKIFININAPESRIGNIYATEYSNISSGNILRNVEFKVQNAKSISGISGGSGSDNFTNSIAVASSNKVNIGIGEKIDGASEIQSEPIEVTGVGIINFCSLSVKNGANIKAINSGIKNGKLASASDHASTYSEFGDIYLHDGSGLGLEGGDIISAAEMNIHGSATIESPSGTGRVNISGYEVLDESSHLRWIKSSESSEEPLKGTWFGSNNGYRVLTINPDKNSSKKITPHNFSGIEKSTGRTFIGDNDVGTSEYDGFGIVIPGSTIEYEVESPGIFEGRGHVSHDVSEVKENNFPLPLLAIGTEVSGNRVQKGKLIIPKSSGIKPKLSFIPEAEETGSWLYGATISTTELGKEPDKVEEQRDSITVDWIFENIDYSYSAKVKYSNKVGITSKSIIVSEEEAKNIPGASKIMDLTETTGGPFLKHDIDETWITKLQEALGEGEYSRKHVVSYSAGTTPENSEEKSVNVVVVKNNSSISEDRQIAVYAEDISIELKTANNLMDISDLNRHTNAKVFFADGRDEAEPLLSPEVFNDIKNTTEEELLKSVFADYKYSYNGSESSKRVEIEVTGELSFVQVPDMIDFGTQKIFNKQRIYWPEYSGSLTIRDSRGSDRSSWQMRVKEAIPFNNGTDSLSGCLIYIDGSSEQVIGQDETIVANGFMTDNSEYSITDSWGVENDQGIVLSVPVHRQKTGKYSGKLSWTLLDVPNN